MATDTYNENVDIIVTEPANLRTDLLQTLEKGVGEPLYPGDERRIFGEALLSVLVGERFLINDAAKQTLLRFASGQVLDELGYRVNCSRLIAAKAVTTLRFSTTEAKSYNIIIPQFTKATADNVLYFATDEDAILSAGSTYVDVPATALYGGSSYNGLLTGSVSTLVDQIAGINGVTNLTETAGGDDGEPYTEDGDNAYRERIRLAVNAFSVAGPAGAYEYLIKSADANVQSVKTVIPVVPYQQSAVTIANGKWSVEIDGLRPDTLVVKPHGSDTAAVITTDYSIKYVYNTLTITPVQGGSLDSVDSIDVSYTKDLAGNVYNYILMKDYQLPTQAQCENILAAVNKSENHPMCDYIHVLPPTRVNYDIELTYYTKAMTAAACANTVEGTGGAIERYIALQDGEIARDINPDDLRRLILAPDWSETAAGAERLTVVSPTFTELKDNEVAHFSGTLTVHKVVV